MIIFRSLGEVGLTVFFVGIFVVCFEFILYGILKKGLNSRFSLPYILVAPAFIGLALLVLYPICYNILLSFSNMSIRRFRPSGGLSYGLQEFLNNLHILFTEPVLKQQAFFPVLLRTFLWTFIQVTTHVTIGYFIAILLNRRMHFRGLYRTLILFPWAIPQIIALLAFRGEFNYQYGYINVFLNSLGFKSVQWMSDPIWNFVAINITNIWLGVPFMAVVLLGALQSIDHTYYEAAEIDGATKPQKFFMITIPLIKPVLVPAIILGVIWTFNNFNVPFVLNQQELETSDILVTALFRAAFQYNRYGFAATFSIIIFGILFAITLIFLVLGKPDIQFVKKTREQRQENNKI